MKIRYKITTFLIPVMLLLIVGGTSCKKSFLDREPYGGLPTNEAIETVDDMETALNGIYAVLRSPNLYGRTIPLIGDELADNVYISGDQNSNRYLEFMQINYTVANGNATGIWQSAYNAILNANNVIHCDLQGTEEIDQFRGEALALRALMYFELAKHFCRPYTVAGPTALGVPIILEYDPFKKPSRNTLGEVYQQIQKDLTDAIPLLTIPRSSGYITEYAAKAILARMHQFKGEWASALAVAEDVIYNSGYGLLDINSFQSYWNSNTPRNDGFETLFEVVNDLVGNADIDALAYFYDQDGYGDALAAQALYNLYAPSDVRRGLILTFSPTRGNVKVVNKYPNTTQPDKDEVKIIRMSEVFLIAAEAAYHTGDEPLALIYLNAIAFERDPFFAGYSSSGAALLSDILLERRKELAFEGHRYWDIARYNQNVMRVNLAGNYAGYPLTIAATNFRRILPIPQIELDANPNIRNQQNPGY
jgi:starch-binding outer membrane protein, SusD/RagB family